MPSLPLQPHPTLHRLSPTFPSQYKPHPFLYSPRLPPESHPYLQRATHLCSGKGEELGGEGVFLEHVIPGVQSVGLLEVEVPARRVENSRNNMNAAAKQP